MNKSRMKSLLFLFVLLITLLVGISMVSAANNTSATDTSNHTLTTSTTHDVVNTSQDTQKEETQTIKNKTINNKSSKETINKTRKSNANININTWKELVNRINTNGTYTLTKDLIADSKLTTKNQINSTLNGNGYSITFTKDGQISITSKSTLNIANITLDGNNTSRNSSVIRNNGTLIVQNSTLENFNNSVENSDAILNNILNNAMDNTDAILNHVLNDTTLNGAVIYNTGDNCIYTYNTFINNTASFEGGAICSTGNNCKYRHNTFINNKGGDGGAIFSTGTNSTFASNTFINNTALFNGTAIYNYNTGDNCIYTYNTFINNKAESSDAAIYNAGNNCKYTYNLFKSCMIYNSNDKYVCTNNVFMISTWNELVKISNKIPGSKIYELTDNLEATSTLTENNQAEIYGNGHTITFTENGQIHVTNSSNLTIVNTTLNGNNITRTESAIYNEGKLITTNITIKNFNKTEGLTGAIYNKGTQITKIDNIIKISTPKSYKIIDENLLENLTSDFTKFFNDNYNKSSVIECNGSSFNDIQKCIDTAVNGSYIHLNGNYTQTGNKSIEINKNLYIYGNSTLDAKNLTRIFDIKSGKVTINGLNLIEGYSTNGSAIYISNTKNNTSSLITSSCHYEYNKCSNDHGHFIDYEEGASVLFNGNNTNIIDNNNHYDTWDLNQAHAFSTYEYNVTNFDEFKNLSSLINNNYYDNFIVNFKSSLELNFKGSDIGSYNIINPKATNVTLNGNNAKIKCTDNNDYYFLGNKGYNFLYNNASDVTINNLTISGFCTACINCRNLNLQQCIIKDNDNRDMYMDISNKIQVGQYGAALINFGTLICNQTNFNNNQGYQAGAISSANGIIKIIDCDFKNNYKDSSLGNHPFGLFTGDAFKKICDFYLRDSILKIYNITKQKPSTSKSAYWRDTTQKNNNIVISRDSEGQLVTFRSSMEEQVINFTINNNDDFKTASKLCMESENYDKVNLFITKGNYSLDDNYFNDHCIFKPLVNIMINGNGSSINVKNPEDDKANHFLVNNLNFNVLISNMTLTGFNTAIINKGSTVCSCVNFTNNKINYLFEEDYGGAIYNTGSLIIINSSFTNNTAKYGGSIYNTGTLYIINSVIFKDNKAYASGIGNLKEKITKDIEGSSSNDIYNTGHIEYININSQEIAAQTTKISTWYYWTKKISQPVILVGGMIGGAVLCSFCPAAGPIIIGTIGLTTAGVDIAEAAVNYATECDRSYQKTDSDHSERTKFIKATIWDVAQIGISIALIYNGVHKYTHEVIKDDTFRGCSEGDTYVNDVNNELNENFISDEVSEIANTESPEFISENEIGEIFDEMELKHFFKHVTDGYEYLKYIDTIV